MVQLQSTFERSPFCHLSLNAFHLLFRLLSSLLLPNRGFSQCIFWIVSSILNLEILFFLFVIVITWNLKQKRIAIRILNTNGSVTKTGAKIQGHYQNRVPCFYLNYGNFGASDFQDARAKIKNFNNPSYNEPPERDFNRCSVS